MTYLFLIFPLILFLVLLLLKKFPLKYFIGIYLFFSAGFIGLSYYLEANSQNIFFTLIGPIIGILILLLMIGIFGKKYDYSLWQTVSVIIGFFPYSWGLPVASIYFSLGLIFLLTSNVKFLKNNIESKKLDKTNIYAPIGLLMILISAAVKVFLLV